MSGQAGGTWRRVTSMANGRQVTSYISDDPDFRHLMIFSRGNAAVNRIPWVVCAVPSSLVGSRDLETREKLVGKIRAGAVNAIVVESARSLAAAQEAARRQVEQMKDAGIFEVFQANLKEER